MFVKNLTQK